MMPKAKSVEVMKKIIVDCLIFGALTLCILLMNKAWQPFERGFFCGDESLMYPYHEDTVTLLMLRIVGLLVPAVVFLVCEWAYLRRETKMYQCFGVQVPTWLTGLYCALVSYFLGYCFVEITTEIAKNVIGRPRPHFFDICQPSVNCSTEEWQGRYIQASDYYCTGSRSEKFHDMRKSFLSGHSSVTSYAMIYVAIYLQARMPRGSTRSLRHCLQFLAVMISWFTAMSRVSDFKHHWSDVLAGYSLGCLMAVIVWVWGTDLVKRSKKLEDGAQHHQSPLPPLCEAVYINNQQMSLPPAL